MHEYEVKKVNKVIFSKMLWKISLRHTNLKLQQGAGRNNPGIQNKPRNSLKPHHKKLG
jgi:hypothetical protein